MRLRARMAAAAVMAGGFVLSSAGVAGAGHDHFVVTPNGRCHQVANGQTSINNPSHGGYHRFHHNVHFGASAGPGAPHELGDGHSQVVVYRDDCAAP